jgi:hypothetical protein
VRNHLSACFSRASFKVAFPLVRFYETLLFYFYAIPITRSRIEMMFERAAAALVIVGVAFQIALRADVD